MSNGGGGGGGVGLKGREANEPPSTSTGHGGSIGLNGVAQFNFKCSLDRHSGRRHPMPRAEGR